jgi:hypothetical protein
MPEKRVFKSLGGRSTTRKCTRTRGEGGGEGRGNDAHRLDPVVHLDEFVEYFLPGCIDDRDTGDPESPGGIDHLAIQRGDIKCRRRHW